MIITEQEAERQFQLQAKKDLITSFAYGIFTAVLTAGNVSDDYEEDIRQCFIVAKAFHKAASDLEA